MPDNTISAPLLASFSPLKELSDKARENLAGKSIRIHLKAGTQLTATQENRWLLYVLEGRVTLAAGDQTTEITADSPRAKQPLFTGQNLRELAVCAVPSALLRVDRNMYESLTRQQWSDNVEVEETFLSPQESAIFTKIYQQILTSQLDLPTLPEIAIRIQGAMNDPETDVHQLSRIIQLDVAVTGSLIKAANSALHGGSSPVGSVRDAVIRLGFDVTRQRVLTIAMRQVFRTNVPMLRQRMKSLWDRSVHVSALSYILARHHPRFDPEHAMLAGLLHQVGMVPLLDHVGRNYPDIDASELDNILTRLHPVVGELVINYWGLGADICQIVREWGQWDRKTQDIPDYCDVVMVAELYRHAHDPDGQRDRYPRYDQIPAYHRLGLPAPDDDMKIDLFRESEEEIIQIMNVLKGGN
ncbi:HD-like signal output (HDOD) domain, no enzymatic activity [Ectothiorhodospira magna]|uniref:HD-like signal output (HDOD) domain, no enzymatic activity n=1 Tax=Ectothiorhodospira magna TaxID=867345 RepID=A0A1H9D7K1_9GAMM|nr:HDOD domain-containing protein [Ectothiorhodospira magna]SEQ09430.1 HD-like signal output (HDOD) domain, no enzymatic activity [Ectothiorhodospira magna]